MNLQEIRLFFQEKYPIAISSRSRKREIVMQRRMIVNFLFNEYKMRVGSIKLVLKKKHQIPCYFINKKIHDLKYTNFYKEETEKFRAKFFTEFPK